MIKKAVSFKLIKVEKELRFRWVDQAKLKIVNRDCVIVRIMKTVVRSYDVSRRNMPESKNNRKKITQPKGDSHNNYRNILLCFLLGWRKE